MTYDLLPITCAESALGQFDTPFPQDYTSSRYHIATYKNSFVTPAFPWLGIITGSHAYVYNHWPDLTVLLTRRAI